MTSIGPNSAEEKYAAAWEPFQKACRMTAALEDACCYLGRDQYMPNKFEAAEGAFAEALRPVGNQGARKMGALHSKPWDATMQPKTAFARPSNHPPAATEPPLVRASTTCIPLRQGVSAINVRIGAAVRCSDARKRQKVLCTGQSLRTAPTQTGTRTSTWSAA